MVVNKLSAILCICLATLVSSPAMASEWVKLGVDESGQTWLVDKSTISRDGGIVEAWSKVELAHPQADPSSGKMISAVSYLQVTNCLRSTTGLKKVKLFTVSGALISEHTLTVYTVPRPVAAGPFLEETIQFVCAPASVGASQ